MGSPPLPGGKTIGWSQLPLRRLYEHLTLDDPPAPSDLIFVLAGRMDRKRYGLELYRKGVAPRLLLSVGRFEVSKMPTVGFEGSNKLIALRNTLPADDRHFFCEMSGSDLQIEHPKLRRWNTYGEILALREFLRNRMPRSLLVISSDVHLRRVALTIDKVFRGALPQVRYCPVPTYNRGYILKETIKLAGYRVILSLPDWMIRRIMRLKD